MYVVWSWVGQYIENKTDKGMELWRRNLKARGLLDITGKFPADRSVIEDEQRSAHLHWPGPTTWTREGSWTCAGPGLLKMAETPYGRYPEEMQGSQCYGHEWIQGSIFYIGEVWWWNKKINLKNCEITLTYLYTVAIFISICASTEHRCPEKHSDDFKKDHSHA